MSSGTQEPQLVPHFSFPPSAPTLAQPLAMASLIDHSPTPKQLQTIRPRGATAAPGRPLSKACRWTASDGGAAKAALIGFTKALAKEEGPSGITVNCVAPGVVETDMMAVFSPEDKAALAEETPLCRLGAPEDVAAAVAFLASDAGAFFTGQVLAPNGGFVV